MGPFPPRSPARTGRLLAAATLAVVAATALTTPGRTQSTPPLGTPTPSLEGTSWSGKDSDGDNYTYTFLRHGALRFRTNTPGSVKEYQDPGDYWAQNGPLVIIVTSRYSTRQGFIRGNRISGDAWNVQNHRWTWEAERTP